MSQNLRSQVLRQGLPQAATPVAQTAIQRGVSCNLPELSCFLRSQEARQLLPQPAVPNACPATSVTGLVMPHAGAGSMRHAKPSLILRATRISRWTLIPRIPRPRVVMPAAGKESSRHANAPMRNGARSAVGCCLSSRPLRISLRVIPGSSPVAVVTIHLYPGSQRAVDLNASIRSGLSRCCFLLLCRRLRRRRKQPDNSTHPAPV